MQFGNYDVIERIAAGSTATVYKSRHRELGQFAAIKELNAELRESPRALQRFRTEAHILAGFDDPHIVTVYDFVEEPGRSWIAEEWVDGVSIETLLAGAGAMTAEQCLGVLRGALQGLAYAHARGIVHGDIAPGNIIADRAGISKLVDFGVSAQVGSTEVYGTPAFMSPEAVRGEPVGPAGDVYSAGALLFLVLAGHPPFPGRTVAEVLAGHLGAAPPPLTGQGPALAGLVADALAKDSQARPRDAAGFLQRLEEGAQERYGAGWLDRASIAGLVGAAMAGAGMGVGALAGTAGGGTAGAGSGVAGAHAPVFVQSGVSTGTVVRRGFWLSRRGATLAGIVGTAVVATGIWVAVAGGSDHKSGGRLAANPTPGVSVRASLPGPVSSAPRSVAPVNSIPLRGIYKIETVVVSTNYESEHVGQHFDATWQFDLSCTAGACHGTGATSGSQFKTAFDGETLTGSLHTSEVSPCVFAAGPKKGKPDPSTRYRSIGEATLHLTVTSRSAGPAPAAGTALTLTGTATNHSPKGKVVKGRCTNQGHVRHDLQKVTLTYVSQ
jgi:serine/threonine-protein kinase